MTSQQEKVVIVKCLYADKNTITQAKANPKLLNEVENLTKTNQDYYEIPPDEGYIKPYFDWDKKLDYEPNEAQIMEVGRNVSKDFEALGFTQGTWATRHGLSASGRHKISFRAWVSDYKTTKADLNRRVKAYKKANPDSDIDDGVYSSERKMGLVNCIKGSTQVYPKDPAYTGSGKKPIYLPDTRILKRMFNNTKPFSATIIGIVMKMLRFGSLTKMNIRAYKLNQPIPTQPFQLMRSTTRKMLLNSSNRTTPTHYFTRNITSVVTKKVRSRVQIVG